MSTKIQKRYNSYKRIDGVILGWERGKVGEGHQASIIDKGGFITGFNWRSPKDPTAGDQVTIVLPEEGVTAKPDRPILMLNHTTGDRHAETNAHDPVGWRAIMTSLCAWILIALAVTAAICFFATIFEAKIIVLLAASLVVWRLAIATRDLRLDERAARRKLDEEALRSEIVMAEWVSNTESRRPRVDLELPD